MSLTKAGQDSEKTRRGHWTGHGVRAADVKPALCTVHVRRSPARYSFFVPVLRTGEPRTAGRLDRDADIDRAAPAAPESNKCPVPTETAPVPCWKRGHKGPPAASVFISVDTIREAPYINCSDCHPHSPAVICVDVGVHGAVCGCVSLTARLHRIFFPCGGCTVHDGRGGVVSGQVDRRPVLPVPDVRRRRRRRVLHHAAPPLWGVCWAVASIRLCTPQVRSQQREGREGRTVRWLGFACLTGNTGFQDVGSLASRHFPHLHPGRPSDRRINRRQGCAGRLSLCNESRLPSGTGDGWQNTKALAYPG